jgi:hypothetical protein
VVKGFSFAHRAFCASLIFFLAAADILRRRRVGSSTASGIAGLTADP